MTNWEEYLNSAKKEFKNASHMAYITASILKENRILIKILLNLYNSCMFIIKAFLVYESATNKIPLYKDSARNFQLFVEKIAPKYIKKEDIEAMIDIIELAKKHQESSLEFVRKEKFAIFMGSSYETINIDLIRKFISSLSRIISSFPSNQKI
jgi:hypothetical protein